MTYKQKIEAAYKKYEAAVLAALDAGNYEAEHPRISAEYDADLVAARG